MAGQAGRRAGLGSGPGGGRRDAAGSARGYGPGWAGSLPPALFGRGHVRGHPGGLSPRSEGARMSKARPIDKVLVIKLGALGDFVLALAAMKHIRLAHPKARITLLTVP